MINNTRIEFLFIRACILFLDNIFPFALVYYVLLAASKLVPQLSSLCCLPQPILAWLAWELVFHFCIFRPRFDNLQRDAIHPEIASRVERENLFHRCNKNISDPENYLSNWFGGANKDEIKRENVKEFLRWAFLNNRDIQDEYEEEIETYTRRTEEMLGRTLPEGRGRAKCLRLTLDEIHFRHRSFLWYMCIAVVDTVTSSKLWWQGFQFHGVPNSEFFRLFPIRPITLLSPHKSPVTHLSYWHRPHVSKSKHPILFVHGIGVGLYPYTNVLRDTRQHLNDSEDGEVGIIALEIMPISFRITHEALSRDVMVEEIDTILNHHGWEEVTLVTHSYGSVVATHLIKSPLTQKRIGSMVLIDPITFLLHHPDVAHNFTARKPVRANEHQLAYFARMDIGVAHTLGRRFFWTENIIWVEELGLGAPNGIRGVTIIMGGRDLIVNTRTVSEYLLAPTVRLNDPATICSFTDECARGPTSGRFDNHTNGTANGNSKGIAESHPKVPAKGALSVKLLIPNSSKDYFGAKLPVKTKEEWKSGPWKQRGLNLLWFEHLDHAQVFDKVKSRRVIAQVIKRYSTQY